MYPVSQFSADGTGEGVGAATVVAVAGAAVVGAADGASAGVAAGGVAAGGVAGCCANRGKTINKLKRVFI
jgi:hypothetical protein